MIIEHAAWTVAEPEAMVEWYCRHLGMSVARKVGGPARTHFLADATGRVLLEVYRNPRVDPPPYAEMDPLVLHLAFAVEDVKAEHRRLLAAGARPVGEVGVTPAGDEMAMLRDPWGFCIQLVRRAQPMG
jgi:catechol 2,3-dioxygenase-like lactoylglutathione lyase family enzyme